MMARIGKESRKENLVIILWRLHVHVLPRRKWIVVRHFSKKLEEHMDKQTTQEKKRQTRKKEICGTWSLAVIHVTLRFVFWCRCSVWLTCLTVGGNNLRQNYVLGKAVRKRCTCVPNWLIKLKSKNMIWNTAIYMRMNYLCCCTASIKEMRWAKPWSLLGWLTSKPHNLCVCLYVCVCVCVIANSNSVFVRDWPRDYCKENYMLELYEANENRGEKCVCVCVCVCVGKTHTLVFDFIWKTNTWLYMSDWMLWGQVHCRTLCTLE